jgi:hypothetical protein
MISHRAAAPSVRQYRAAAEGMSSPDDRREITIGALEEQIRERIGALRYETSSVPDTLGLFQAPHPRWHPPDLTGLPPDTRVLEFFYREEGGGCWLIDPRAVDRPVWVELPGLTSADCDSLADRLVDALIGLKESRARAGRARVSAATPRAVADVVDAVLTEAIRFLRTEVIERIDANLQASGVANLVIVPYRGLHVLPIHAALSDREGIAVSYAPSLAVLGRLRRDGSTAAVAAVGLDSVPECPARVCDEPRRRCWRLPGAQLEGHPVCRLFRDHCLDVAFAEGPEVTLQWIEEQLPHVTHLHLASHAFFDPLEPGDSGVALAVEVHRAGLDRNGQSGLAHDGALTTDVGAGSHRQAALVELPWRCIDRTTGPRS